MTSSGPDRGHDHGAALARDLGYTPVYLHYNTGLHLSINGAQLADVLEELVRAWPVPIREIAVLAHSMGVSSRAAHATMARPQATNGCGTCARWCFLGTPHHGAPMERGGNWIDLLLGISPYSAPLARLGKLRSAGITDLRYGNLTHEDWQGRDRFARGDRRCFVPLPEGVRCYAIAATTAKHPSPSARRLPGDGLVPVASALGEHDPPRAFTAHSEIAAVVAHGCGHLDLLDAPEVYRRIRRWLGNAPTRNGSNVR
jgi:hypothetical protein